VRLTPTTDGRSHAPVASGVDDHHSRPRTVSVLDTTTAIAGGATFNLDVALGVSDLAFAQIALTGPQTSSGGASVWRVGADVIATRAAGDALGHSIRRLVPGGNLYRVYVATYSKLMGDSYLAAPIFSLTASAIVLQDAVLTGSVLRLTFRNVTGSSATLWVKGSAVIG